MNNLRVAYISSFAPRVCGIASFTRDLIEATKKIPGTNPACVIALNRGKKLSYPKEVVYSFNDNSAEDFRKAAEFLNNSDYNLVCLQHEYGLYGGEMGDLILNLTENLEKPLVTVFHMISPNPTPHQIWVTQKISQKSKFVIALSRYGKKDLMKTYKIDSQKIRIIPHGVPDIKLEDPAAAKKKLGLENNKVLSSIHILRKSRGVDIVLNALPAVIKKFPNVIYLILGTDPDDSPNPNPYRVELEKLVSKLKIQENVKFENRYLSLEELIDYLKATDIFLTPYRPPEQSSSGSLAYAVAAGKVCISSPYSYAKLLLGSGRGRIVPWEDSQAVAKTIIELFSSPEKMEEMSKKTFSYGRKMVWDKVGREYYKVFLLSIKGR